MWRWTIGFFLICVLALAMNQEMSSKPRVFVTDSQSWEIQGSSGGSAAAFGGHAKGGARPQTAEIIKTFGERCPEVTINNRQDKADYIVLLDHEGGKSLLRKDNKVAVFNREGDSILSGSTRSLGNSVQDACNAIRADWPKRLAARANAPAAPSQKPPEFAGARVQINSDPAGADIEIDGSFMGSTPSEIELASGEHSIVVKKTGYRAWERKIRTTAGEVNVSASLEKLR